MRRFPPQWESDSAAFAILNRGKRSKAVDLKSEKGREEIYKLLHVSDILIEQFRPGVMDRLGFGYDAISEKRPDLIYCSISGYGQSGPRAGEAGHDVNYIGATGLLALGSGPTDKPAIPPALVADIGGGSFPAVINILLALRQRDATGRGCHLDIAMTDAMFTFAWHAFATGAATGRFPESATSLLTGASPRYQLYPTSDGRLVACGALEEHFWQAFIAAIELDPALAGDDADPERTKAAIAARIAVHPASHWRPILAAADCCCTIVASLGEAMQDPHFVKRGLFAHQIVAASGATIPALPVPIAPQFRAEAPSVRPVCALDLDKD